MTPPSIKSYAQTLAGYRTRGIRASEDVVLKGTYIIENGGLNSLGDEQWALLEQLGIASLDTGRVDIVNGCIKLLDAQFPGSSRVEALKGMKLESTGAYNEALGLSDRLLAEDPTNAAITKRRISVFRQVGQTRRAIEELISYLDTFYADAEAWLELADIYSSSSLYHQALSSLSHALLLAPQNPFYVIQAAETAYTAGDIPLAMKFFLRGVELAPEARDAGAGGVSTRGWYGVKLCARRLLRETSTRESTSDTSPPAPKQLALLDELATERLLAAYSSSSSSASKSKGAQDGSASTRGVVLKWLQGK